MSDVLRGGQALHTLERVESKSDVTVHTHVVGIAIGVT